MMGNYENIDLDMTEWGDYYFGTDDVAPINLNREITRDMMESILDESCLVDWEYMGMENEGGRSEIHFYEIFDGEGKYKMQRHRCGLTRGGNGVKFESGTTTEVMWSVVMGVYNKIKNKRSDEFEESGEVSEDDKSKIYALQSLDSDVKELDVGEFRELESCIDIYNGVLRGIWRGYIKTEVERI